MAFVCFFFPFFLFFLFFPHPSWLLFSSECYWVEVELGFIESKEDREKLLKFLKKRADRLNRGVA